MDKKHAGITAVILAILVALVYSQFRMWKNFDWGLFLTQTHSVSRFHILHGIALIYIAYVLRAVRWKIFLRPVRPEASTMSLVAPTLIGFTGLALLGRPGELIRPYLVAKQEKLPFSSQLAVWAVERIFDIGGFTFLFVLAAFVAQAPRRLGEVGFFREAGALLVLLVTGLTVGAIVVHRYGELLASWAERWSTRRGSEFGHRVALRIREFRGGLNTIHDKKSLLLLIVVSVLMWAMIAVAYKEVTHAYGSACNDAVPSDVCKLKIPQTQVFLLMASSMVGSLVQLPGVGGGSQFATIEALNHIFGVPPELATSCGIMLWLVTFVAVVPVGLLLAHRERLSLRKLSAESHEAEKAAEAGTPAA
ncbi:MAG TPA: lysylphosphatidylglycerol synthase transmembrane domain-containing protein [Terriglobales bacterium]|nr:lysylphosphatidylglycerol synthase transmembrane domain-containing protein [Terriglobales bacterium]